MKKAFSVFTPMIGTAIFMIAVLLSSVMLENDVRLSRGISSSYELSSQSITGKIIKAAASIGLISNLEELMNNELADFSVRCSRKDDCISSAKGQLLNELRKKAVIGSGFYSGVTEGIEQSTSADIQFSRCEFDDECKTTSCCVANALYKIINGEITNPVKTEFTDDGKLSIKIDSSVIKDEGIESAFEIKLIEKENEMVLLLIPEDFTYTSSENILDYIKIAAEFKQETDDENDCDSLRQYISTSHRNTWGKISGYRTYNKDGNSAVVVEFDNGMIFKMFDNEYVIDEYNIICSM